MTMTATTTLTMIVMMFLFTMTTSSCTQGAAAASTKDRVLVLPGQPAGELPFHHFAGYISLQHSGMAAARKVFYYFVQHDNSSRPAAEAPLLVWFNAGRVCSSFGYGGMLEVGPLRVQADMTLRLNPYSWHKEANLLFIDLPAGVGFSYSENLTAAVLSDKQVARDAVSFLLKWTEKFPEHRGADLYFAGEGHGTHHAVNLAVQWSKDTSLFLSGQLNLKGLLLGNPQMDLESMFMGFVDFLTVKGMMSPASREKVLTTCLLKSPADCVWAMEMETIALGALDLSAITEPVCMPTNPPTSKFLWFDPCSRRYLYRYMNKPSVHRALHANSSRTWQICSDNLRPGLVQSINPWITEGIKALVGTKGKPLKLTVYHGDGTARPPTTVTSYGLRKVFNGSNPAEFGPWTDSTGEAGGYKSVYLGPKNNLTYYTVRGAGSYVGSFQPIRARDLFKLFLY